MIIASIDGVMAAGKTFLFRKLEKDSEMSTVQFIEEPVVKFKNYKGFNPLKEYYQNPGKNAAVCQLYFLDALKKHYTEKLNLYDKYYVTERNLRSCAIFTSTQFNEGFISDFHYEYILDKIEEAILLLCINAL